MSIILVGMLLHNALLNAGHSEWHTVNTALDFLHNDIMVRFDSGVKPDGKSINFRIPDCLFDPVEYAQKKWPEWFVKKPVSGEQLDLFKSGVV